VIAVVIGGYAMTREMFERALYAAQMLRLERVKRGWSLSDVVEKAGGGFSTQTLSGIETGKTTEPGFRVLVKLGGLYGWTPNDMAELYGYWTPHGGPVEAAETAEEAIRGI
jgi:transcriptional regulator with XRE-family HTH domain